MKYWKFRRLVITVFFFTLILGGFLFLGYNEKIMKNYTDFEVVTEGWVITKADGSTSTVSLSSADIGVVNEGESITISRKLEAFPFAPACFAYYTIHAMVDVYLDGEHIYNFGQNYYEDNLTVPQKINVVPLGDDYAGKELKIITTGSKKDSFSGLAPVYFGTRTDLMTSRIMTFRTSFFTGIFLFSLGLVLLILSPYLFIFHNQDLRLLFNGLISVTLGVYILSFYGIIDGLVNNPLLNTVCEYTSLFNIPTVFMGYLMVTYKGTAKKIFTGIFIFDVGLFLSSVVLHFLNIRRFSEYTIILHTISMAEAVVVSILIVFFFFTTKTAEERKTVTSESIFLAGILAFGICASYDIFQYNYVKYVSSSGEVYSTLDGTTLGSLALVSCLLLSYLFYNLFNTDYDSKQSRIADLAYTDPLTGLSNRARCEQMMSVLTKEHDAYTIISLDLNKLKMINDTLGHHEGDRLLTGFATILSDCFWDANLIGRMGGDEFIIIMIDDRALNTTKRIHEFYTMLNDWNRKETAFSYSASYGYAYSYEVPNGSAQEVYMLADSRMYEMKREHQKDLTREVIRNA